MFLTNAFPKFLAAAVLAFALSAPALNSQVLEGSVVQFDMIGLGESQTLRLSTIAYPPEPVCIAQLGGPVGPTKTVKYPKGRNLLTQVVTGLPFPWNIAQLQ